MPPISQPRAWPARRAGVGCSHARLDQKIAGRVGLRSPSNPNLGHQTHENIPENFDRILDSNPSLSHRALTALHCLALQPQMHRRPRAPWAGWRRCCGVQGAGSVSRASVPVAVSLLSDSAGPGRLRLTGLASSSSAAAAAGSGWPTAAVRGQPAAAGGRRRPRR